VSALAVHFSSARPDWATPVSLFSVLDAEFGFTLDPCCVPATAKCARYFTPSDDGLSQSWAAERVFMNPPYGRSIAAWMQKAHAESRRAHVVVALVPARTDTSWWHEHVIAAGAEVRFLRGRIRFEQGGIPRDAAPFPSAVIVYRSAS
jgi:phage N-6-adenine-methyltransferase